MAVASHPLRITERDVIKEQSVDEWFNSFKGLDLHIRVLHARDLSPSGGLPDPYCKITCGPAKHQTATQRRTMDPNWGEEFYLEWGELSSGKRLITLEVWDWDFWRPDELLGRGFININDLTFEPLEVQKLEIKLYPSSVRRPQDIKPAKQQKPSPPKKQPSKKQKDGKQQQQQQRDDAAPAVAADQRPQSPVSTLPSVEQFGQPPEQLQQQQLLTSPSFRYLLTHQPEPAAAAAAAASTPTSPEPAAPNSAQKQQQQQHKDKAKKGSKDAPVVVELGSVGVALWWEPTRRSHGMGVAERVSFCLLPGEVKVPPVVTHSKLGTLYEEPCIVYIKLSLLEVHLGGSWYLEYLDQTKKDAVKNSSSNASRLQRVTSSSINGDQTTSWDGFQTAHAVEGSSKLLQHSESLEDALVAVSGSSTLRRRRQQQQQQSYSSGSSSPRWSGLQDRGEAGFWGGYDSPGAAEGGSGSSLFDFLLPGGEEDDGEDSMTPADALRRQQRQQQLLQQHLAAEPVFALAQLQFGKQQVRESIPVRLRPGGAAVFREQFVFTTKRPLQNKRLVMEVVLRGKGLPGGKLVARRDWSVVELLMASPPPPTTWLGVQALKRCQVPGVLLPLQGIEGSSVELIAAAADADGRAAMYGVPPLGLEAAVEAGISPAGSLSDSLTPRRGSHTPRSSIDFSSSGWQLQQQQQQQEPWLIRILSKQMGWRRVGVAGSAPNSPRYPSSPRSTLSAPSSSRHSNLLRSPFAADRPAAVAAAAATTAAAATAAAAAAPGAAATVSALSTVGSADVATAAASAAAAATTVAAVEVATAAAAAAAAGREGDVAVPDELSPIPGLPVRPEPGGLSGPLATLQLVIHRREANFAWELSVPIYHPTTTLVMVVYGEAGRGKITFLGKLHYRISYLMYLNHREVVKCLKLRTNSSSAAAANSQGSPEPDSSMGTGGNVSGVVVLTFTCSIPDRQRLMKAYERSPYPPMVHQISLFHAAKRDDILQSHHRKVVAWLSTVADPPIPPVVAWKVLETGRESFKLSRSRHNIQRLKVATSWIPAMWGYFTELKAWVRPWHNIISVFVMACVCFYPRFSLFAFLLWRSVVALRRLLMHGFVEYLGVDLGELFAPAGLLPSDFLYDEGDDDDDAASITSSSSGSSAWGGGSSSAPAGAGGWGGGGGGGVRDSAAVMIFQPRRLQRLKRRYEQLLRISLQVQNRIDDIAMAFERLHAMVTGQDPLATALFFWRCLIGATALWALGPGPLLFVWWCWEVLRPPSWRKPPGVKGPVQFVINLPSRSLEEG